MRFPLQLLLTLHSHSSQPLLLFPLLRYICKISSFARRLLSYAIRLLFQWLVLNIFSYFIQEREVKAKHQQLISGVNFSLENFWSTKNKHGKSVPGSYYNPCNIAS